MSSRPEPKLSPGNPGSPGTTVTIARRGAVDGQPWTPAVLVLHSPDQSRVGERHPLVGGRLVVGRDERLEGLRLCDPTMSRQHARCVQSGTDPTKLVDLDSRNGVFVNGRPVREVTLAHGDLVRVGDSLLCFEEQAPTDDIDERASLAARIGMSVLLLGETGTGKEVTARKIHTLSQRKGSFIAINCGAIPRDLIAAELFGHAKGAFSGASQRRTGVFLAAQGGTLLLDEIGDCPVDVQVALLRALEERAVRPVGEEREVPVDVQVVAATHCDLESAIKVGSFRADLFARLAQYIIRLPPLRERRGDLLTLASVLAKDFGCDLAVDADAAEALLAWHWPYNIRELRSVLQHFSVAVGSSAPLTYDYLQQHFAPITAHLEGLRAASGTAPPAPQPSAPRTAAAQRAELLTLLEKHRGNVTKVAEALGKPRVQVYRWVHESGLSLKSFRS